MTASIRLESQLSAALRSLEPTAIPARTRLRISTDLREPTPQRRARWHRTGQILSAAATIALLVLWAGLILAVANSVANAGPAATPVPTDVPPTLDPELRTIPDWPVLRDPSTLLNILAAALLVGAGCSLPWIKRRLVSVAGDKGTPAAPRAWPRRPWRIPRLVPLLALLPASYWITQPYVGHALWPEYSIQLFLSASFGWAAALRYPASDRSARWLIVGGTIVALGRPMFLDAYAYMQAAGWACIAVGLSIRAGITPQPRWFVVAAVAALALWLEIDSAANQVLSYGPPTGDWDPWNQLLSDAVLRALALVALAAATWAAWQGWRRGGGRPWLAIFVGIAGVLALEIYAAQSYWILIRVWESGLIDPEDLFHWQNYNLSSIFSVFILLGLLGGLGAVARRPAAEDAATQD